MVSGEKKMTSFQDAEYEFYDNCRAEGLGNDEAMKALAKEIERIFYSFKPPLDETKDDAQDE
jgi:hypothetical protein